MAQKTTLKEFEAVYPKLEEALLDHAKSYKLPEKELEWLKKVSDNALIVISYPYEYQKNKGEEEEGYIQNANVNQRIRSMKN